MKPFPISLARAYLSCALYVFIVFQASYDTNFGHLTAEQFRALDLFVLFGMALKVFAASAITIRAFVDDSFHRATGQAQDSVITLPPEKAETPPPAAAPAPRPASSAI